MEKQNFKKFKKEFNIITNMFVTFILIFFGTFISILCLLVLLFFGINFGPVIFISLVVCIFSVLGSFSLMDIHEKYEKKYETYNEKERFISNENNYDLLSLFNKKLLHNDTFTINMKDDEKYSKYIKFDNYNDVILRKLNFNNDKKNILNVNYFSIQRKDKEDKIIIKKSKVVDEIDLNNIDNIIDLYDNLINTEVEFKIFNEIELKEKLEFIKENKNIIDTNFDDIPNIKELRGTYIEFIEDIKRYIINYVQLKEKEVYEYATLEEKNIALTKQEKVNKALKKSYVIKQIGKDK